MKILMVHPHDLFSDQEPWTVRPKYLAQELLEMGHEVRLAYFPLRDTLPAPELAVRDGLPTVPLGRLGRYLVGNIQNLRPHAAWADIVHFQKCLPQAAVAALVAATLAGKPVHYDWDDWETLIYRYANVSRPVGWYLGLLESLLPSLVSTLSVSSERLREEAVNLGFPAERIYEAPVGADLERFRPDIDGSRVRALLGNPRTLVLYSGQLHGAQYAELFLRAARQIRNHRDDVRFVMVGSGVRLRELQNLAGKLELASSVIFTGPIPHAEVPRYLAAADILVASFQDDDQQQSKSPLKIVEYLAMGKPIVSSRVGEVPRMIGDAGLLVEPGSDEALAYGIEQLLQDATLRASLGAKARRRVESRYNWRSTAENLARAYETALETHAQNRRNSVRYRLKRWWMDDVLDLEVLGALDGREAFQGPRILQLDLVNECNNNCAGCWCHSFLLREARYSFQRRRKFLPAREARRLIDEAYEMGVEDFYLSGGGEPMLHPELLDLLRYIQARGMSARLNTNFSLANDFLVDEIVRLGLRQIQISLWASNPESYVRTHPGKDAYSFRHVDRMLRKLARIKEGCPDIKIMNVMSNLNCQDFSEMIAYACDAGADAIEFTPVDVVPGRSDNLLLSEEQRQWLYAEARKHEGEALTNRYGRPLRLENYDHFLRRLSGSHALSGDHDRTIIDILPCYIGWTFARIHPDGLVNPCLKAHGIVLGNIRQDRLGDLWKSEGLKEFRRKARVLKKDDPIFQRVGSDPRAKVGCYRSCDDLERNLAIDRRIKRMSPARRFLMEGSLRLWRWLRGRPSTNGGNGARLAAAVESTPPRPSSPPREIFWLFGPSAEIHDRVFKKKGHYRETVEEISRHRERGVPFEIEIRPHKVNFLHLAGAAAEAARLCGCAVDMSDLRFDPRPLTELAYHYRSFLHEMNKRLEKTPVRVHTEDPEMRALMELCQKRAREGEPEDRILEALGAVLEGCFTGPAHIGMELSSRIPDQAAGPEADLSAELFDKLLGQCRALSVRKITFAGLGEPLLHPRFLEFCHSVLWADLELEVETVPLVLDETLVRTMLAMGLSAIELRFWRSSGQDGTLEARALERTRALLAERKRTPQAQATDIRFAFRLTPENWRAIDSWMEAAASLRPTHVLVSVPGAELQRRLTPNELEEIRDRLDRWRKRLAGMSIQCLTTIEGHPGSWGVPPVPSHPTHGCLAGWRFLFVTAQADVLFCYPGGRLGNLAERSLEELWHSAGQQEFRRSAKFLGVPADGYSAWENREEKLPCQGCVNLSVNFGVERDLGKLGCQRFLLP